MTRNDNLNAGTCASVVKLLIVPENFPHGFQPNGRSSKTQMTHLRPKANSCFVKVMHAKSIILSAVTKILMRSTSMYLQCNQGQNLNYLNLFALEFLQFHRQGLPPYLWRMTF